MALVQVGDLSIDMTQSTLNIFPGVSIPANVGRFFVLQTLPVPAPLPAKGYFVVIPIIQVGSQSFERPAATEWFPKSNRFGFKVSTPREVGNPVTVSIAILPIVPFGNFPPGNIDVRLFYEDTDNEPPTLVV